MYRVYKGIIINLYKDPHQTNSISWKRGHLPIRIGSSRPPIACASQSSDNFTWQFLGGKKMRRLKNWRRQPNALFNKLTSCHLLVVYYFWCCLCCSCICFVAKDSSTYKYPTVFHGFSWYWDLEGTSFGDPPKLTTLWIFAASWGSWLRNLETSIEVHDSRVRFSLFHIINELIISKTSHTTLPDSLWPNRRLTIWLQIYLIELII